MGRTIVGEDVFQCSNVLKICDLSANFLTNLANHCRSAGFAKFDAAADGPTKRLIFDRVVGLNNKNKNRTASTKSTYRDGADTLGGHFELDEA